MGNNQIINQCVEQCSLETQSKRPENIVSDYTSVLVHELRNPLNNIMLSVESLNNRLANDIEDKMYLDIIRRGINRLNNLIDTILNSKECHIIDQGAYSLHKLLDEVLESVWDRITIKDLTVHKIYEKKECIVTVNAQQMKMALSNIMINAVEAMVAHNGHLTVTTRSADGGNRFIVQIDDTGYGIRTENLKNLFSSHFTTKRAGMGFGLAATFDILHANHVKVSVKSKEGVGTCFRLVFEKG